MTVQKVTIEAIQEAARQALGNDGEAEWQEKLARFQVNGRDEAWIAKRREGHINSWRTVHNLAAQVLKLNPRALSLPSTHGGDLDKPVWQRAAAMLFGLEAEVDWPMHSISRQ